MNLPLKATRIKPSNTLVQNNTPFIIETSGTASAAPAPISAGIASHKSLVFSFNVLLAASNNNASIKKLSKKTYST